MCRNDIDNTVFEAIRKGTLPGSELVIGLVGPVGANLARVENDLKVLFQEYGYVAESILVSSLIGEFVDVQDYSGESEYARIDALMTAGNKAREKTGENAILALRAAHDIYSRRNENEEYGTLPTSWNAWIIKSLKRPEEVNALRRIYGNGFFLIGVYVAPEQRRENLIHQSEMEESDADSLINRDEKENQAYGQRTRDTFYLSDVFVHLSETEYPVRASLQRFLDIVFSRPHKTPLFDEYAMFMAFAAATRSADLSRQIGAVIARETDILATGANECPRAGGGTYWPNLCHGEVVDSEKGRDYKRGCDSNDLEKNAIIQDAIEAIRTRCDQADIAINEDLLRKALESSSVDDITEYGRVVHAEMDALLTCARNNISCQDATLYTTTFPCHNCAKHIIAAGIRRVVYIEPYPKSKALKFHDDAAFAGFLEDVTGSEGCIRVAFEPFVGIGPRRFFDLFSMTHGSGARLERKYKSTGNVKEFSRESGTPRIPMLPWNYLQREGFASSLVKKHLKEEGERNEQLREEQGEATQSDAGAARESYEESG